jgi:hypothetical protein
VQVGDDGRMGQAEVGAALFGWHVRVPHREAADVHLGDPISDHGTSGPDGSTAQAAR